MNILLAEDSDLLRKEIERALVEIAGVKRVVLSSSVAETREAVSREVFDLIMLDFALGDGTALDLLNDPPAGLGSDGPPVIILSIHASKALCQRCLAAGASHCFDKTSDWESLIEVIEQMAGGSAP
ncbi:MAG TPA: response regulator [Gemmatimonadota bacterium]|nr:response regulator [Gemmatimonadota bacterium]